MERFYSIAGSIYRVDGPDEWMYLEDGVLAPFRVDGPDHDYHLELMVARQLMLPVGECIFSDPARLIYRSGDQQERYEGASKESPENAYCRITRSGEHSAVQIKQQLLGGRITAKQTLNAMETEHRIVENGGFLLHASYIRWRDRAILFTAPSGTGKSTQAELWSALRGAELINGDRAVVRLLSPDGAAWFGTSVDQQKELCATVWGTPYSGSSRVCKNVTLPLAAIVCLSQAPDTTITPLTGVRAFRYIWEGCSVNIWDRADVELCTQTISEIIKRVPVFYLACTPDETAVRALERELERLG